jgi:hypothetical protein
MSGKAIAAAIIGIGVGLAAGYFIPMILPKPKVTITPNPVTPGQTVTFTITGFPPNTSLMSMGGGTGGIGSAPLNIGATDSTGKLVISGAAPNLSPGSIVLYVAFAAANPTIYASTAYYVATT